MGCGASRESTSDPAVNARTRPTSQSRSTSIPAFTSQTAINPQLSTTTSQQQQQSNNRSADPAESRSNASSPRTSSQTGRRRSQQPQSISLTEHYNAPLQAPKPWKSKDRLWTKSQLQREREDFFETRVTGRKEIWAALKRVAECVREGELADAQGILDAVGVTLPNGKIEEGGYDESGVLYRLPQTVLSDPVNMLDEDGQLDFSNKELKKDIEGDEIASDKAEVLTSTSEKPDKGKEAVEKDALKIKCRLSDRGGPDSIVLMGISQPVSILVRRLKTEAGINASVKVRMAYLGRILDEQKSLEDQGWSQGHVVQGLVIGASG